MTPILCQVAIDGLQAWGAVAGTAFAAVAAFVTITVLVHELRTRRREQLDRESAQARSVLVTMIVVDGVEGQHIGSITITIRNFSQSVITDVSYFVRRLDRQLSWVSSEMNFVAPGESREHTWTLIPAVDWPAAINPADLFLVGAAFTDANGLRWHRQNRSEPQRRRALQPAYSELPVFRS
jgi:hypothetical protein